MKKVLVTGGAGFIGSHLTEALLARGDVVSVIDDESTGSRDNLAESLDCERLTYVHGRVEDADLLAGLLADADEVYHLAAAVGVALIAREPIESIERNIYPTQLLLGQLRAQIEQGRRVKLFLASSSEVYGRNPKKLWTEEDDLVFGPTAKARWSYGASKAIDEFLTLAYWRQHRLPVVVGRLFNVVGPRQTGAYGMVLPRFVSAALDGGPLVVHDDGRQVRCFAHVADVVGVILRLMDTPAAVGRAINVGSDVPIEIMELARQVRDAIDPEIPIQLQSYADAYDADFEDVRRRVPDLSLLKQLIDFRPTYDLPAIVREVVDAQRRQRNG
jgi:UDP-glucose 4-epimerase